MKISSRLAPITFSYPSPAVWLGRLVQPIKWLVPFAILGAIYLIYKRSLATKDPATPAALPPLVLKNLPTAQAFCTQHQIDIRSPLLRKIEEIESETSEWKETDVPNLWLRRASTFAKHARALLELVEDKDPIQKVITDLRRGEAAGIWKTFKELMGRMKAPEVPKKAAFLQQMDQVFSTKQLSVPTTLEGYLATISSSSGVQLLSDRGVTTLTDIDCLELRTWDQDYETLIAFECALKAHSDDSAIRGALNRFLAAFAVRMTAENRKDHICTLKTYISQSILFLQNVKNYDITSIVQGFNRIYQLKQREQLSAYLTQTSGHSHWQKLKEANRRMSLVDVKRDNTGIDLYNLDRTLR